MRARIKVLRVCFLDTSLFSISFHRFSSPIPNKLQIPKTPLQTKIYNTKKSASKDGWGDTGAVAQSNAAATKAAAAQKAAAAEKAAIDASAAEAKKKAEEEAAALAQKKKEEEEEIILPEEPEVIEPEPVADVPEVDFFKAKAQKERAPTKPEKELPRRT